MAPVGDQDSTAKMAAPDKADQDGTAKMAAPDKADQHQAEEAPDPDEGDLDDLDDMLDEFSTAKTADKGKDLASSEGTDRRPAQPTAEVDSTEDEFTKQLQEQMAALLGNTDESPEMQRDIEAMMKELGATASSDQRSDGPRPNEGGPDRSFQETIKKTMQRMQASGDQASIAADSESPENILAQLLKDLPEGAEDTPADEEGFNKMLLGMMEQLTNKEILYEPMKELYDKFPAWFKANKDKTKPQDLQRYEEQHRLVKEIVARFERKEYSDQNSADREFIVDRMQQMQAAGSPPADLVGDMNAAQDAMSEIESGCPQQ